MKKYIIVPVALLFISALVSFKTPGVGAAWVKYTSTEGHFSMNFPGKPEESSQDDKSDNGTAFKIHFASYSPTQNDVYMAGWIDMTGFYPEDKDMKEMLEASRDGATESMKATDIKTITTSLGKEPYIEFTFKTDDFVGKDRIYIINKFQYSIITIFSKKTGLSPNVDKFITSFKHID
jgi:hypothetical protein